MKEGKHTEVHYDFQPEAGSDLEEEVPVIPFPEGAEQTGLSTMAVWNDPGPQPPEEMLAGCCDHTSASVSTRRRFKKALKQLGIPVGVIHDSCFGLMNHLDSGEEYRWQHGKVEQFDREAYEWKEVK